MPFGLIFSGLCHTALLLWAFWSMRAVQEPPAPETPMINAEIITPSEFLRLKQGAEDAKKLETKAKEEPKPDDSKNDTKKPDNAPPPPPPPKQEEAKVEPPPPAPEPPKKETPPPPPPPEPTPGPTPDEQKLLEKKIEDERLKAEADAKKKADDEAKKKAEEAKKKAEEDAKKKKLAEEAAKKKKLEEQKKKFSNIGNLLDKLPDDAEKQTALLDKDPTKKGQQAAGTSQAATETGKEAGTKSGADTVLSAREQDLLAGMIKSQLHRCSKMPGGGGGVDTPVVTVQWRLKQDGSLDGEPTVVNSQNSPLFQIAAEASLNAVRNCSPLNLPADKYAHWSRITWDFDWPQILGLR